MLKGAANAVEEFSMHLKGNHASTQLGPEGALVRDEMVKALATRELIKGFLWLVGGTLVAMVATSFVKDAGGMFFVLWGGMAYGGYRLIRALWYAVHPNALVSRVEKVAARRTSGPPPLEELLDEQRPAIDALSPRDRAILDACSSWIDMGVRIDTLQSPAGLKNLMASVVTKGYAPERLEDALKRFQDLGWLDRLIDLRKERIARKCDLCTETPWVRTHRVRPEATIGPDGKEYIDEGPVRVCATCAKLIDANSRHRLAKHRVNAIGPVHGIEGVMPPIPRKVALAISLAVIDNFFERRLD